MTVLFGSTSGTSDLGISRIRKAPDSDTLFIGRSSQGNRYGETDLADNCFVTVLNDVRVWSKIPYIDDDGVTFQDSDLDFATYGATSPPVANAGAPFAATIDSGTSLITATFSGTGSFATHPSATISSYLWRVSDGTITVGTSSSSSITVTFPAGFRLVTLTVTDSNSKTHTCYVPVLAIDPDDDATVPNFTIERHTIGQDGQALTVRVRSAISSAFYLDNTMALLIDGEPASASDRSNILFYGFIETEPTEIDATDVGTLKDVVLNLVDVAGRLKSLPGFPQVIEHAASPATWQQMTSPNVDRFMAYLLQWQSTALDLADFTWSGTTTTYPFLVLESTGQSIWEQVARKAQSLVPTYALTCNTLGQLRVIVDPMLIDSGSRTATVQVALGTDDYSNLRYTRQRHPRYHWTRSNAIVAGASTPIATAFSIAPGTSPGQGENDYSDGENIVVSQAALNAHCGHLHARLNATEGRYSAVLAEGDTQGVEPANMTWVTLTIDSTVAAQRGLTFTAGRFLPHELDIRYRFSREGITKTVTMELERETSGIPGVTETVEAAEVVDDGGWNVPPPVPPQFNNGLTGGDVVGFIDEDGMIFTTSNFTAGSPTWAKNSSAVGAVGPLTLKGFVVDPFSPGYRGTGTAVNAWVISNTAIWRITDIFGTPAYTSETTFAESIASSGEHGSITASFGRFFPTEADNPWIIGAQSHRSASAQNGVYLKYSDDAGATWSSEIRPSTFTQTIASNQGTAIVGLWLSPRTPGFGLIGSYSASGTTPTGNLYKTTDWGATWSLASEYGVDFGVGLGYCVHVPWEDNSDESILYFGKWTRSGGAFHYSTYRSAGGSSTDISPTISGTKYGPIRPNFGIRSLDTDRQQMVMIGIGDSVDDVDPGGSGNDAFAAVFVSSDGGDTWTPRGSAIACGANSDWPMQCAFASGDANIVYIWGNDGYVAYSTNNGASFTDKQPTNITNSSVEIVGICGGPTA